MQARHGARGFTLIEVMVALGILALVAVLSWRRGLVSPHPPEC